MNPENPDTTFPVVVERWRSREEIRREYLDSLSPEELRQVNPADYWVKYGLPAWQREQARKSAADQSRVPAGNSDGVLLEAEWDEKAGFRRNQPRWAKGTPKIGGRWSGGAGTDAPGVGRDSSGVTRGGHHFVPRKIFDKEPLRPETREVFERGVTGPLNAGPHRNSEEHFIYNEAVHEKYRTFLRENGIRAKT
ncbi:MAG: hypothetical protein WDO17_22700 [Alphaproteobacteria bacterium]